MIDMRGIKSLPGNPLNPESDRPFIVDEDGNVIYRDESAAPARSTDGEKPIGLATAGILNWD